MSSQTYPIPPEKVTEGYAREIQRLHTDISARDGKIECLRRELDKVATERDRWRSDAKERAETIALLGVEIESLKRQVDRLQREKCVT